jgi:hypothetical protein
MAMRVDFLTTEMIRKKFKNNFDLCTFAINVARGVIMGGQQATLEELLVIIDLRASEYNKEQMNHALKDGE